MTRTSGGTFNFSNTIGRVAVKILVASADALEAAGDATEVVVPVLDGADVGCGNPKNPIPTAARAIVSASANANECSKILIPVSGRGC